MLQHSIPYPALQLLLLSLFWYQKIRTMLITITVTLTDTDSAVFNLFVTKAISAKGTSELLSQPLVVQESEIIKVTAATANRLHVVLSALEIKPRVVTS